MQDVGLGQEQATQSTQMSIAKVEVDNIPDWKWLKYSPAGLSWSLAHTLYELLPTALDHIASVGSSPLSRLTFQGEVSHGGSQLEQVLDVLGEAVLLCH